MSPRHLADVHLPNQLAAMLSAARLPGAALTVEVTEDSIMSDPERAGEVLRRIRDLGIAVSIDDFGTGYSSLAYLRDLAATEVKIDKTFVLNAAAASVTWRSSRLRPTSVTASGCRWWPRASRTRRRPG